MPTTTPTTTPAPIVVGTELPAETELRRREAVYEEMRATAKKLRREAVVFRAASVREAIAGGLGYDDVARVLNVQRSRVSQIRSPPPPADTTGD